MTDKFRVLSLDGGGAKGFYSLGALHEIELLAGRPLHEQFDLIYGTSTGAIIASLLCLGHPVSEIVDLYRRHVVKVMAAKLPAAKSSALKELADTVFGERRFEDVKTRIGVVATRWVEERPMIFKADPNQAYRGKTSFVPGFGVSVSDAVQASCSAYPFFNRKIVTTSLGENVSLMDGGYCANNPTLYAIADAARSLQQDPKNICVVSIGVGEYPMPSKPVSHAVMKFLPAARLLQKALEVNTQSMDQLRSVLFEAIPTVRINDAFTEPEMATDMFEHNQSKLDTLYQRGRTSYRNVEPALKRFFE